MVSGARLTAQLATPFDSRVVTTVTGEDGIGEVSEPITGTGRFEITIIDIQGAGLSYSPAANLSSEAFLESGSAEITVEPDSGPSGTEATLLLRSVKPDAQYQVSQSEAEIMDEDMEGGEAIFSRAVEGCRGDVVNFTALIQTYSGPQEREASFTITDPLCQEVHVDGMDAFYEVFEGGDTEVLFLVEIVDAQGRRDSVGAVWVLWMIEGPEGFLTEADARTNESGVAEFRETVSEPGTYVFTVVDLAGEGIEYDRSANEVFGHKIDVAVFQGYTTIEGEKGLISAQIPAAWSYSTELMEGASVLYAAPDLPSWIDAMERSEGVEGPGFAIALFPVPSAEGPVTLDLLHELLDEVSEISNCGFAYRQELFTEEGEPFGLQEELECEGGGSLISSVKFDPSSPFSFLVFFARLVSDEDFAHYKRSLHTLRWEPLP
jgi:hypothetical protein